MYESKPFPLVISMVENSNPSRNKPAVTCHSLDCRSAPRARVQQVVRLLKGSFSHSVAQYNRHSSCLERLVGVLYRQAVPRMYQDRPSRLSRTSFFAASGQRITMGSRDAGGTCGCQWMRDTADGRTRMRRQVEFVGIHSFLSTMCCDAHGGMACMAVMCERLWSTECSSMSYTSLRRPSSQEPTQNQCSRTRPFAGLSKKMCPLTDTPHRCAKVLAHGAVTITLASSSTLVQDTKRLQAHSHKPTSVHTDTLGRCAIAINRASSVSEKIHDVAPVVVVLQPLEGSGLRECVPYHLLALARSLSFARYGVDE